MGKTRTALLREASQRWLSLFTEEARPTLRFACDGCVDSLVTVELHVNVVAALERSGQSRAQLRHLRKLREAIDILCKVLQLAPATLWPHGEASPLVDDEILALQALEQNGTFAVRVVLDASAVTDTALLTERLCRYFAASLDREPSDDPKYLRVRRGLERELTFSGWNEHRLMLPVHLRVYVATPVQPHAMPYALEEQLRNVTDFITYAEAMRPAQWIQDGITFHHVPVEVELVVFSLEHFLITHRTLQLVKRLENVRAEFAVCLTVCVDPDMVQCTHQDITAFLNAISARCVDDGLYVQTGPEETRAVDPRGTDRSEACATILRGVANCAKLERVDLGGMMRVCTSPASRNGIYGAMLDHVLSRATPCDVAFQRVRFEKFDVEALKYQLAKWRSVNPDRRLRARKLELNAAESENAITQVMLDVLDDVEELRIDSNGAGFLPATTLPMVLRKFDKLRTLDVSKVNVSSMAIFLDRRATPLEELRLSEFRVPRRDDFVAFVRALGDPTSPIARTLRKLGLQEHNKRNDGVIQLCAEDADLLAQALEANHVLTEFCACFSGSEQVGAPFIDRVLATAGRVVRACPIEKRQISDEQARRVAFLSVLELEQAGTHSVGQLDSSVVRHIFEFSSPAGLREFEISFEEADESDIDDY